MNSTVAAIIASIIVTNHAASAADRPERLSSFEAVREILEDDPSTEMTDSQLELYKSCRATRLNSTAKCVVLILSGIGQ